MGLKSFIAKRLAKRIVSKNISWHENAVSIQQKILKELVQEAQVTVFGREHNFDKIVSYDDYKKNVPVADYEAFRLYVDQILKGEKDVLWKGVPQYMAKTSGTTSGVKYIPISKESMPEHIKAARNALLFYIAETGKTDFIEGKMIFLQGSPLLTQKQGVYIGRLSGIVAHHVPKYLQANRLPSWSTNCIEEWEDKVDAIVDETINENMTLISGIPPWVQMYFDKLIEKSGAKKVQDVFTKFSLFVYGGVNFEPYKKKIYETIGKEVDSIETYPASEGFIAYQNSQKDKGLLLQVNAGIFYEFIPVDDFFNDNPTRLTLGDIELGVNYVIVLTTNAGLWAYNIGDTVKFVSKNPYKIVVTGRIKHFISAFGEHVIAEEVDYALMSALKEFGGSVTEYTVAPQVNPSGAELPYHEWLIEFDELPQDMEGFKNALDVALQNKNIYYSDLIKGKVLQPLKVTTLPKNAFVDYMRLQGKLGGQNKVPRLSNDRNIADSLSL